MKASFDPLALGIGKVQVTKPLGRICNISAGTLNVRGLNASGAIGQRVKINQSDPKFGEIIGLSSDGLIVLPEGGIAGLRIDDEVTIEGKIEIFPDDSWLGRIIDPMGQPIDGDVLLDGLLPQQIEGPPPKPSSRKRMGKRLATGSAVFDTILPIVRGQRIGLFAGSGVGKSSLLGSLATKLEADVVVIALVGERGRELREFSETVLGPEGKARSVIVAATSDRPASERKRCILSAMAIAEHFRDKGHHVLFLADSVTRFAEAQREIALAGGELPSLRGYPPSLQHEIMSLAERAGPGAEGQGDITAIFSVLVAGSDMDEPVADILRGVLDGHVVMDRKIAERGRYPAIDVLRSVSRSLPAAASAQENAIIARARQIIAAWERSELMVQAGLYQRGSDALTDLALQRWPALDAFIGEPAPDGGNEKSFQRLKELVGL